MTDLTRLESDDPAIAGVLFSFPSGLKKVASWHSHQVILDQREFAEKCTVALIDDLLKLGAPGESAVRDTNWVSVVAAMGKLIADFNADLVARESAGLARRFAAH